MLISSLQLGVHRCLYTPSTPPRPPRGRPRRRPRRPPRCIDVVLPPGVLLTSPHAVDPPIPRVLGLPRPLPLPRVFPTLPTDGGPGASARAVGGAVGGAIGDTVGD